MADEIEHRYRRLLAQDGVTAVDLPELVSAYRDLAGAYLDAKRAQVEALNRAGLSLRPGGSPAPGIWTDGGVDRIAGAAPAGRAPPQGARPSRGLASSNECVATAVAGAVMRWPMAASAG